MSDAACTLLNIRPPAGWLILCYVGGALAGSLLVRLLLSVLRAFEKAEEREEARPPEPCGSSGAEPPSQVAQAEGQATGGTSTSAAVPAERGFCSRFGSTFLGSSGPAEARDYWQTFVLGFLELLIFPALISTRSAEYIGAWIGLKTLVQWKSWTETRRVYNRFLIGTALLLILSVMMARHFTLCPEASAPGAASNQAFQLPAGPT